MHRAGGTFAGDLDAGDVVADFHRQIDTSVGFAVVRLEREGRVAERQAFEIERADGAALLVAGRGAQHFDGQRAGGILDAGQRACTGNAAGNDRNRMLSDGLCETFR